MRLIGKGSYGEVWLARNVMGTYRAVKVVYRSTFDHDGPYEREFAGIRKFEPISRSQASQVDILHIGRNDAEKYFYYVMELADDANGGEFDPAHYVPKTLEAVLDREGRQRFSEGLRISVALANALNHLHQNGLVHRDIKPSNIIFVNGIPKLADIGLVTESEATVSYVGAHGFMPPEGPGRPQGDIYSLGKVIYELCTGRDRLDFPALSADFGDWPDRTQMLELIAISLKAGDPDAAKRYASAEELIADLLLLQAGKSVRRLRWLERNRRWAVATTAVALLVAIGVWLFQIESRSRERERERTRQREVWVQQAHFIRLIDRTNGWSSEALGLLSQAARIKLDDDLRAQAAATLDGVDAQVPIAFATNLVKFLAFDAQGRRLVMDGEGGPAKILDSQTGQLRNLGSTNTGPVWFDREGNPRQFVCDDHGVCRLLNLENGVVLREYRIGDSQPTRVAVSKDGTIGGAAFTNGFVIWEIASGRLITNLLEDCSAIAFAPDNSCFATGDQEGNVRVRTLPDLSEVAQFQQGNVVIDCLAFGRDPTRAGGAANKYCWWLSAGDSGGTVNIYQLAKRRLMAICRGASYNVLATAFSPDGMTLASAGHDYDARLWDVVTGKRLLNLWVGDNCGALAFSADGRKLAAGNEFDGHNCHVHLIPLERGRGVTGLRGLSSSVSKVTFSHDGQRLAALANNWEAAIWNLQSNRLERVIDVPKGMSADNAALEFSLDDRQLAFSTLTDTRLWDLQTGQELRNWKLPQGLVQKLCFCPNGRLLQFQRDWPGTWDQGVCCVRELTATNYEKPLRTFSSPKLRVWDACFSPLGDYLVIIGEDTRNNSNDVVRVFNPQTGQELCALPRTGHSDNDWFVTDPQRSKVGYWQGGHAGTSFFQMPGGQHSRDFPSDVIGALSPDGETVLDIRGSEGRGVVMFNTTHPARQLTLGAGHPVSTGGSMCFSPDGKLAAWGTIEGTVFVCELEKVLEQLKAARLGY